MEDKIRLIDEIVKRHPSYGVDKGWSYYVGGMKDTGDWYFRKMLDIPIEELQAFLDSIITDENTPKIELTPEELADSKIIIEYDINGIRHFSNLYNKKKMDEFVTQQVRKMLFGK